MLHIHVGRWLPRRWEGAESLHKYSVKVANDDVPIQTAIIWIHRTQLCIALFIQDNQKIIPISSTRVLASNATVLDVA